MYEYNYRLQMYGEYTQDIRFIYIWIDVQAMMMVIACILMYTERTILCNFVQNVQNTQNVRIMPSVW